MTKQEAVDLIFLNVNGGKASADASVKRYEIEAYLGLALASAIQNALYTEKSQARADKAAGMLYEDAIPESFYTTVEVDATKDNDRGVWTAVLPKALGMEYGWGIKHPRPKANPERDYIRLPNPVITSSMPAAYFGVRSYWTEETTDSTILYFNNVSVPVCTFLVSAILDPKYIGDEDTIKAPKDALNNAVRIATEYFRAQAGYPASERLDDKAPNEGE